MIRQLSVFALLLCLCILNSVAEPALASHPFHVSRAEVDYNAKRKTLEVALCVWPEDLEKAVSKMEKSSFRIDDETEKKRDLLFKKYVEKKFRFLPNGKAEGEKKAAAVIRWVGSEIKIKQGWLYFEVDVSDSAANWKIENSMFFELNDDQMNHIQVRNGKVLNTQTLSDKTPSMDWAKQPKAK